MYKFFSRFGSYVISFLVPFLLLGCVLVIREVYPFGENSILMTDLYTQYIQFYNHFYDVLKGNGSMYYSWEAGMGLNFWATFAYYLASPVSFVVIFFDRAHLPEAIILMLLIKIGFSGLFMNIYLSKQFNADKITKCLFSTLYALISFSIGYFFNIMWLDSIYMLPLVLLGVEYLFEKRYFLFISSLSILFISNFYMAYMTGIFTFFYFVVRSISASNTTIKVFLKNFFSFMVCTGAAAGISAFITIPTYMLLRVNNQPLNWSGSLNPSFGFFDFIPKLYNSSIHILDMPNVFSGILPLLVAPLFFISSKINNKEKILYFLLLCFMFLSFQVEGLNYIWHAFEKPSGYQQRFAFVFSFLLIYLAFRAYIVFEKKNIPALFKIYITNMFILMVLTKFVPELMSIRKALFNMTLLTVFSLILYGKTTAKKSHQLITVILLFFVCLDMGVNAYSHLKTLNSYLGYSFLRSQYDLQQTEFVHLVANLNNQDEDFYRVSSTMTTFNDESLRYRHFTGDIPLEVNQSFRYSYKGMSNFNTLSNGTLHQFMNTLGYSSTLGSRSLTQNNGILSSDSLFGFKYWITNEPINKHGFEKVKCKDRMCIYRNKYALPIGFMMNEEQTKFQTDVDNPFEKQNQILGPIDQQKEYYSPVKATSIRYNNIDVRNDGNIQYIKKVDKNQEGSIEMTFDLQGKKQLYTLLSAGRGFLGYNETTVYVNGKSLGLYPTFHNDRILDLGAFLDETVTIKIEFMVPEAQLTQQLFYALNISSFEQRISEIKREQFDVTKWADTTINGNINVKRRNTLFLSIPYDIGWNAEVDGKAVAVKKLGGFIGVDLEKGTHDVKIHYKVPGLNIGFIITNISILSLLAFMLLSNKKKNKK